MEELFISYNCHENNTVETFYQKLLESDYKVFKADSIQPNQKANAIKNCKIFICFITKAYLESKDCNLEMEYAYALRKRLIFLMIENIESEIIGAARFIIN